MVKAGEADIAVGAENDAEVLATPVAWEGIAVIVDVSNPLDAITIKELASVFTGRVRQWAEVGDGEAEPFATRHDRWLVTPLP